MKERNVLLPKQKRSISTKKKIKKAAKKLFSEFGYYNVTSNMIVAEAKVPVGSFYNYFKNKKNVILELIKDWNLEYQNDTLQHYPKILKEMKSTDDVFHSIEETLQVFALSEYLSDPFYKIIHSLQFTESDVLELSEEIRETEILMIHTFLEKINTFYTISNIEVKAKLILNSYESLILYIHHLGTTLDKEELINESAKMLYGFLILDKD